jgi:hypothetical protein
MKPRALQKCVFCLRDDRKITNEHVIGQQFRDLLPKVDVVRHETRNLLPGGGVESAFVYAKPTVDVQVQAPCKACNSGWMRAIDDAAFDVLKDLVPHIRGRVLNDADQRAIATWVVKTSMMWEYTTPENLLIPQAHRTWMYERYTPPRNTHVWVGAYSLPNIDPAVGGSVDTARFRHDRVSIKAFAGGTLLGVQSYMCILSLGSLISKVLGTDLPNPVPHVKSPGPAFAQILPVVGKAITWPPGKPLSLVGFEEVFGTGDHTDSAKG